MSDQAYESVKIARDSKRPTSMDYINAIFRDFFELHGDRRFGDDAAIVAGLAHLGKQAVTVIAIEKGHSIKERNARHSGAPHPEGYRKALRLMKQAEKFHRPVICFVDTSGAYCGIGAEARGQGQAIAENIITMMALKVPVISVFIGEGGSRLLQRGYRDPPGWTLPGVAGKGLWASVEGDGRAAVWAGCPSGYRKFPREWE